MRETETGGGRTDPLHDALVAEIEGLGRADPGTGRADRAAAGGVGGRRDAGVAGLGGVPPTVPATPRACIVRPERTCIGTCTG